MKKALQQKKPPACKGSKDTEKKFSGGEGFFNIQCFKIVKEGKSINWLRVLGVKNRSRFCLA